MKERISVQELHSRIETHEPLQLIDVRSAGEYAAGHVPQALNIPLEDLESRLPDLGSRPIAILCQSGTRAGIACEQLEGIRQDVMVVEGGTSAWKAAGYEVTAPAGSRWSLERQVRLGAGLLVLIGAVLALTVHPSWVFLSLFVGAGLTFAGLTNICGMALLLAKLPWNKAAISCSTQAQRQQVNS